MAGSTPTPQLTPRSSYSRDRVITLSDAVFAIASTLLVLEVLPHIASTVTGTALVHALLDLTPELVTYFLSFLVIGQFWNNHRNFFYYIYLADSRVSWNNLLISLWITLIPATAAVLGTHWKEPTALIIYAFNLLLVVASYWLLWRYVSSARYVREEGLPGMTNLYIDRYAALSLLGYALVIPAAFLSPPVALALVFLTTVLARTISRRVLTSSAAPPSGAAASRQGQEVPTVDDE